MVQAYHKMFTISNSLTRVNQVLGQVFSRFFLPHVLGHCQIPEHVIANEHDSSVLEPTL